MKRPQHALIRDGKRGLVPSHLDGRLDVEYNAFLDGIDPEKRAEIRLALAITPDPRFKAFLARLGTTTPRGGRITYAAHAKACGIGLEEFHNWFNKAQTQRTLALCIDASVEQVQHMIEAAKNRLVGCDRCDGRGWVEAAAADTECSGWQIYDTDAEGRDRFRRDCPAGCTNGKVLRTGDDFRLEKILEIAGHINKRGPGIILNQNFGGAGMGAGAQQLASAMTIDVDADA